MSELSSNGRRIMREVARDAAARERAEILEALRQQWLKVAAYNKIPGILRRGMLSGINKCIEIVEARGNGSDQPTGDRKDRPDEGAGG